MKYYLSICIPTYNRAKYIGETIESVLNQAESDVEIAISDNASVDDTQLIVEAYQKKHPNIVYYRWPENAGADRNFLKAVEIASGEYCWLMGSDDKVEDGAIRDVLAKLDAHKNLAGLSVNVQGYDVDLKNKIYIPPPTDFTEDVFFNSAESCFSALGAWFGYLSAQLVHRQTWQKIVHEKNVGEYFNAYVHVYIIAEMLKQNPSWLNVNRKNVGWRSGNDSFLVDGRLRRLAIDVNGYEKIAGDVFGRNSDTYHDVMRKVATVHVRYALLAAKLANAPSGFFGKAWTMCRSAYAKYWQFWIKTAPIFILPSIVLRLVRYIYRITLKKYRVAKIEQNATS